MSVKGKAVLVVKTGLPDMDLANALTRLAPETDVEVGEREVDAPGYGKVRVQLTSRPINPADIMSINGKYPGWQPKSLPAVPGLEGVGTVEKNGPEATKFKVGQRVIGVPWPGAPHGNGTWQQYYVAPEHLLVAVPDNVDDTKAAQFLVNPLTAFGFFDVLQPPRRSYLLQTAASSQLGHQVIGIAKRFGIKTINVVRKREHVEELKAAGADEVIVSTEEDIVQRVNSITDGKGAFACINPVGGDINVKLVKCVRDNGTLLLFANLGSNLFQADVTDLLFRGVHVKRFWVGEWLSFKSDVHRIVAVETVMQYLADGTIGVKEAAHFQLEDVHKALIEAQVGHKGKVFLDGP